jgi:pimeloyl-ACP methyl ester carboxylesterase
MERLRSRRFRFRLFAALLAGHLSVYGAPAGAAPRHWLVTAADGVELRVTETGRRGSPAILLVHGLGQSSLSFRRQFAATGLDRFHVVAFDLRGHAGSAKPNEEAAYVDRARWADDLAAVIGAAGLSRPTLVGWSYGGWVIADYVRKYGTRGVKNVLLVGSLAGLPPPAPVGAPARASGDARQEAARSLDLMENISAGLATSQFHAGADRSEEDRRILFATEMMLPAYARRAIAKRSFDNSDLVSRFSALPMLFVRGSEEFAMPEDALDALLPHLPRARLSRYPGIGHAPFLDAPDRFNSELAAFAAGGTQAAAAKGDSRFPPAGIATKETIE